MRVVGKPWLRADHVQRDLRQNQHPGVVLFARLFRNAPLRAVQILPPHSGDLGTALRGQQRNVDKRAELAVRFRLFPGGADLVVGKNAGAGMLFRVLPAHAAHDRHRIVVVPDREPVHDRAHNG